MGIPWARGDSTEESMHETDGQCVSYQLSKHIKIKGESPWSQQQIAETLIHITEELYEDNPENDPYDGGDPNKIGFTATAITQLCRELGIPIHIKWGGCKIVKVTCLKLLNMNQ